MKEVKIHWLERIQKGEVPSVFKNGRGTGVPGDALFAEIEVDGITFACTVIAHGNTGVKPEHFELAIRAMEAGLLECTGKPQQQGVYVIPEGKAN